MAKELMEIGGFITSGAEIVNHDASLSGNGTVDSPLGLNETVLWESPETVGKIITGGITLSESMNNFNEIKFVYKNDANYAPVDYISPHSALTNFNFIHGGGVSNAWMQWAQFASTDNNTKVYMQKCKALNFGNATSTGTVTITASTANDLFYLYQVVGINRKAQ